MNDIKGTKSQQQINTLLFYNEWDKKFAKIFIIKYNVGNSKKA